MQIFLKEFVGSTRAITVNEDDTISEGKQLYEDRSGMSISSQRWMYARKNLDDNKTFKELGITTDSTIHIMIRIKNEN